MEDSSSSATLKFSDKVVVITGSGTGIGQTIAKKFAENGANIVIMGRRKEPLDKTSTILNDIYKKINSNAKVRVFSGIDVSDEEGINSMFESIKNEFNKVDIIINNAGVSGPVKIFTNSEFEEFKDCVNIHLTGTFWTSVQGLKIMTSNSKIITISTFFTEENKFEQRPYRFRTPYTAAQGAKNRLSEALAWELVGKEIKSICTNPGPVHSDRIYKTVYPKAAAEFIRIGGYDGLSSVEIEKAATKSLLLLGESDEIINNGLRQIAMEILQSRIKDNPHQQPLEDSDTRIEDMKNIISGMLQKIQEIAEKVQNNTSKMIVDNEFLTQEDVADMVLTLSDDKISKLINGRIIPNDRVFYPVKPVIATFVDNIPDFNFQNKVIVITTSSSNDRDIERVRAIAQSIESKDAKQVIVLTNNPDDLVKFNDFHSHSISLLNQEHVKRIFNTVITKFGSLDGIVHFMGDYDYNTPISSISRHTWDKLVENFIYIPALITKESVKAMIPNAVEEPSRFKDSQGIIVLVGPDSPAGRKISGEVRSRSEIFRGALRPFIATVNQELSDVLGSKIKVNLILAGNNDGNESKLENVEKSVLNLLSGASINRHESIFYIDEVSKQL